MKQIVKFGETLDLSVCGYEIPAVRSLSKDRRKYCHTIGSDKQYYTVTNVSGSASSCASDSASAFSGSGYSASQGLMAFSSRRRRSPLLPLVGRPLRCRNISTTLTSDVLDAVHGHSSQALLTVYLFMANDEESKLLKHPSRRLELFFRRDGRRHELTYEIAFPR